jgi:hypothetical protein
MQQFILGKGELVDWEKGDLSKDNRIDSFDMCLMRRLVISK